MNKIVLKTVFIYLVSSVLSYSLAQDNTTTENLTASDYEKKHTVIKESNSFEIDNLMKEARNCYLDKKYQQSKEKYLKAISILSASTPNTTDSQKKISHIKDALANVYTAWSQDILQEAQEEACYGKSR